MIIHIFTAERHHLVPGISKGMATVYNNDANHFFILYGGKDLDKLYIEQYEQIGFSNYFFCHSLWKLIILLFQHRKDAMLFHAGSYFWHFTAILLGCSNVNWICWGGGTKINNSWRSRFGARLKRFVFSHFRSIVTLMEPERQQLIKNFHVDPKIIQTISYCSTNDNESKFDLLCKKLLKEGSVYSEKPVVLLGNSHYWIDSYMKMLHRLKQYAGKIKVQCMLNYEFEKNEKYQALINLGLSIFGDDFKTNEEFYSNYSDYINYMNGCDIYICAVEKQTGLGAISACLRLGKKIYITGDNYEWVNQAYHAIVFPLEVIDDNLSYEEFVKQLPEEDKMNNYYNRVNCNAADREKWHNYLRSIDNNQVK